MKKFFNNFINFFKKEKSDTRIGLIIKFLCIFIIGLYIGSSTIISFVGIDYIQDKISDIEYIEQVDISIDRHDIVKFKKSDIISKDIIVGDYNPTSSTYYPSLSFSATASFGDNFETNTYINVGVLRDSSIYGVYFYKASGYCNFVLRDTDNQTDYYLGRYSYDANDGQWELVLGSDGYLGILQLIDSGINFIPQSWMTSQTTTYTIVELGILTTNQQIYNYYYDTYTILGSSIGAYNEGVTDGENNVKNNPNNYGLYSTTQYNDFGTLKYNQGLQFVQDNPSQFDLYTEQQLNIRYSEGVRQGETNVIDNPNQFDLYTQEQYNDALANGGSDATTPVFRWLVSASQVVDNVLSVEILPNVTIGLLVFFPIIIGLLFFVLKVFFGG